MPPPLKSDVATMLRTWMQFVRLPAVFTAMADIFLGYMAMRGGFQPVGSFLLLLGASSCLYLSGMIFNDIFDREADAKTRSNRPLPSGKISLRAAVAAGVVLMASGIGLAAVVSLLSLYIALALAACILIYDGVLKATLLGPLFMGGCRFLNVCLGASTREVFDAPLVLLIATGLGLYVLGVTWFARTEDTGGQKRPLQIGLITVIISMVVLIGAISTFRGQTPMPPTTTNILMVSAFIFIAGFAVSLRMSSAIGEPKPELIQATVRYALLSIITLDASLVLFVTGNPILCIATMLLCIPAIGFGRVMRMT